MKRYRRIIGLSLLVSMFALTSQSVLACLNPIGQEYVSEDIVNIDGRSGPELVKELQTHKDRAYWTDVLNKILDRKKNDPIGYYPMNHAVALAHIGRAKEAIPILEEIERKKPGQYPTAANLGTVYELNGENEKALQWITEGFRRNSSGHSGTEWLHVKILEAKIRMANGSGSPSVLDIRFEGSGELPEWYATDHLGKKKYLKDLEAALVYQLHERLEFVTAPEPIVADLLADLSKVVALTRTPADAEAVYELAKTFGTTKPLYVKPSAATPRVTAEGWSTRTIALFAAGAIVLVILVGFALRRATK